jgi:hypothetical protein
MKGEDKPHRVGDAVSVSKRLFASHTDIDEDPEDETWSELIE